MRIKKQNITTTLIIILLYSCTPTVKSPKELQQYILEPSHGLLQQKEINGTTIKLTYKPGMLFANQEINVYDTFNKKQIDDIMGRYNKQLYFILSLSRGNKEILSTYNNQQWFGQMVNQFAFGMGEDVSLVTDRGDTLQLLDFHHPRMYGMAPSTDILMAFEKPDMKKSKELKFEMKDIGLQTGDVKFKIKTKDIRKVPKLKIDVTAPR